MHWQNLTNRKIFQKYLGKDISDKTWDRYQHVLEEGNYPVNSENIQKLAELKKSFHQVNLKNFNKFLQINSEFNLNDVDIILGKDFLGLIEKKYTVKIHRSTISKWFKVIGGYVPEKLYNFSELKIIAVKAWQLSKK